MEFNTLIPGRFTYIDLVQMKNKDGTLKNEYELVFDVNQEAKDICNAIQRYKLKAEEDLLSPFLSSGEIFPSKVDYKIGPYWMH